MEVLYWGIGMHLGLPWAQNKHGHVLGDVTDQGKAADDPTARGNELGGVALPFHCDGSDLVGLMCLENGRAGGLSAVASSVTIHNRLVAERPDLAAALYDVPLRLPGGAGRRGQAVLLGAGLHRVGRPALRPRHPALHPRLAAPPGRTPPHAR